MTRETTWDATIVWMREKLGLQVCIVVWFLYAKLATLVIKYFFFLVCISLLSPNRMARFRYER